MKILIIIILNIFSQTIFAEPLKDYELNKILWCYNEKLKLLSPNEKFNFALKSLLEQNWYHLFIDKERLEKHEKEKSGAPHLIFDIKEPGYYQAMFQTFKSLGSSIGLPITLSLIIKLHDQAVDQVYSNKEQLMSKGISSNPFNFGWIQKPSQKALEELSTSAVLYDDKTVIEIMPSLIPAIDPESNAWVVQKYLHLYLEKKFLAKRIWNDKKVDVESIRNTEEEWEELLKPWFEHYEKTIKQSHTLKAKIAAIAEILRALSVAHLLPDGNQRTYAFVFLTKMLIDNNLPPAILDNPYDFDGYLSLDELVEKIQNGIKNFLNLNPDYHREMMATQCSEIVENINWINDNDYEPYFKGQKPIKKIVADFYNKLVDGSFNKTYSKFYDTLPFGASDLIIKFLTQGEEPSSSERYPLEQSLLTYPKMVQLILNFYESTTILSKVGENDLIASIMYLYNSGEKNPNALKIFKERLPDHPLGHLLSNDLKSFESSLLNNPKILTESRPKVKLLIDLLYKREKTTEWEIVIKVLQHVDEWTKQDLLNFANIVQTAVEYNDFTTIEALLSIKAFKEQPELLARKKRYFFSDYQKLFSRNKKITKCFKELN